MDPKVKRTKTPEQALAQLMRLCARAEKSSGDALRLMRTWGVDPKAQAGVLDRLVEQRFIDDERYAAAFLREKVRLSGWGAYKIRATLSRKGIARPMIDAALAAIDPDTAVGRLAERLESRMRTLKAATPHELRGKLLRYGLSLGYEYDAVADAVARLAEETPPCDEF